MHLVVSFGFNFCNFFGRELAHAYAFNPVIKLPVNTAANGAHERAEVEDDRLRTLLGAVQTLLVASNLLHGTNAVYEPLLLLRLSHNSEPYIFIAEDFSKWPAAIASASSCGGCGLVDEAPMVESDKTQRRRFRRR
jgi:hypothetical protein